MIKLSERIDQIRKTDANKLHAEYQKLVDEVINRSIIKFPDETFLRSPSTYRHSFRVITSFLVVSEDMLVESMPGNIRQAHHFIALLKRFIEFLKRKLKTPHVTSESPSAFIQAVRESAFIEKKSLRYFSGSKVHFYV